MCVFNPHGEQPLDKVLIDKECCKGCELCIITCPRSVLAMSEEFNGSGYHYSVAVRGESCTSCTFCAVMCPDTCIEVYK
jgi:2-oxoglutarate ferredoxin oxidoreductase subunit delta